MILEATLDKQEYGLFCGPVGGGWGETGRNSQKQEKEAKVHVRCNRLH